MSLLSRSREPVLRAQFVAQLLAWLVFSLASFANAAERKVLHNPVADLVSRLQPEARVASAKRLNLVISLPLRNREALTNLLQEICNPASPRFRQYLTPEQFTQQFGPTEEDYQAVMDFAKGHDLLITGTHPNRTILDVSGRAEDIEKAFHVNLRTYRHPFEARTFFAPDSDPSIDLVLPALEVVGLDDYVVPRPLFHKIAELDRQGPAKPDAGTGPAGTYMGNDFRKAYVPGVSLTGAGQIVGLFQLDGYYTNDPVQYAIQAGLTNAPTISNIYVAGFGGTPGPNNVEVALDIEMVMSMAPGAQIVVYMGTNGGSGIVDVLNRMVTDNLAKQLSASWSYGQGPTIIQIYQQMALQGQTFFNSSGDRGAYYTPGNVPRDVPYVTYVGGTTLTTESDGSWVSETAWNWASTSRGPYATGGGIGTSWSIPSWQLGIDMSANLGSTNMRNGPDVAMVADHVYAIANNGLPYTLGGTSVAAPLWAGFTALVNEKAASQGHQLMGFMNPALYAIGKATNYSTAFHDITAGNNTNSSNPTNFYAVTGYDLCTGWGSPKTNLIDALLTVNFTPTLGWTLATPPDGNYNWTCVASSDDGATLVVGLLSGPLYISTTAGATWRSGPPGSWRGVASSADGTKLFAAPWRSPIYASTNSGVTWTPTTAPSYSWRSLACSADGTKLAAGTVWEGLLGVWTNSGATWQTASGAPGAVVGMPVGCSRDGNILISGAGHQIYISTNWGASGRLVTIPEISFFAVACSTNGSIMYGAGNSGICMSTNFGVDWTITSAPAYGWSTMACSADGQTVVAACEGADGVVCCSRDGGSTWINITPKVNTFTGRADWRGVYCSADGSKIIAAHASLPAGGIYTGFFPIPPSIWRQPASQTVHGGLDVTFSINASGTWPLTYQWYFGSAELVDGPGISGATTPNLTLKTSALSQAGDYRVRVVNPYGSANSDPATLFIQMTNLPVLSPITILSDGTVRGALTGLAGPIRVEASSNLVNWETLSSLLLTNAPALFHDSSATNFPQKFYRVLVQ